MKAKHYLSAFFALLLIVACVITYPIVMVKAGDSLEWVFGGTITYFMALIFIVKNLLDAIPDPLQ